MQASAYLPHLLFNTTHELMNSEMGKNLSLFFSMKNRSSQEPSTEDNTIGKKKIVSVYVNGNNFKKLSRGMVSELQKLDQQREYLYSLRLLSLIM